MTRVPTAPHGTEHQEQTLLIRWAQLASGRSPDLGLLFAIPNGGHRHVLTATRLKAEGVRAGVPDLCLPVPRGPYHGWYGELKVGKNRPSAHQEDWMRALRTQGYRVDLCYGWEAMRDALLTYLALEPWIS